MGIQPTLYMLIGLPGSGKSTWITNEYEALLNPMPYVVLSTDKHIESLARISGKTYNETFSPVLMKNAEALLNRDLEDATRSNYNIIWDQTNMSRKQRVHKLARIPKHYRKVAIIFKTGLTEDTAEIHRERLDSRPGKTIPEHVLQSMRASYVEPTREEGFDEIFNGDKNPIIAY